MRIRIPNTEINSIEQLSDLELHPPTPPKMMKYARYEEELTYSTVYTVQV